MLGSKTVISKSTSKSYISVRKLSRHTLDKSSRSKGLDKNGSRSQTTGPTRRTGELDRTSHPTRPFCMLERARRPTRRTGELDQPCRPTRRTGELDRPHLPTRPISELERTHRPTQPFGESDQLFLPWTGPCAFSPSLDGSIPRFVSIGVTVETLQQEPQRLVFPNEVHGYCINGNG